LLFKKEMVRELSCNVGKQFKKSFPKESNLRAKKLLELIHTDGGPIKTSSLDKSNHFFSSLMIFQEKHGCIFLSIN